MKKIFLLILSAQTASFSWAALTYNSSAIVQNNTGTVLQGSTKQELLQIYIYMTGTGPGPTLNNITFNTDGSTNAAADLAGANAKVWYNSTLTTSTFSTTTLNYGSVVANPNGSFAFSGALTLVAGYNYFWLSYDVPAGATICNTVCANKSVNVSLTLSSGGPYTPLVGMPPVGRQVDGTMVYGTAIGTQPAPKQAYPGTPNTEIFGIEITATGSQSPLNVTQLVFNANGTTNVADISNAKLWYTATSSTFSATTQAGSTVASVPAYPATFSFSGFSNALAGCDTVFYWLTYDVSPSANISNLLDAECTSVTVGGSAKTPVPTATSGYLGISNYPAYAQKKHAGNNSDYVECLTLNNTGVVAAGYTFSFGAGSSDVCILQTNLAGDLLWHKTYGTTSSESAEYITQGGGGFLVAGTRNPGSSNDMMLMNTDANGNVLWNQSYGVTNWGESGYWVDQVTGGGYIVAGQMIQAVTFGDMYLVKTSSTGTFLWGKSFGGTGNAEMLKYVKEISGGYFIAGTTTTYGAGLSDIFLAKTDVNGNLLWSTTYGSSGLNSEEFVNADQTTDGGFIITGSVGSSLASGGAGDFCLLKVDVNGNFQWFMSYGGSNGDDPYWVEQTADGGYIVGGSSASLSSTYDFLLVKTDPSGTIQWTKGWGSTAFSTTDYVSSVKQSTDGSYWLTVVSGFSAGGADYGILHLDATGNTGGCDDLPTASIISKSFSLGISGVVKNVSPTNFTVGTGGTGALIASSVLTGNPSTPASTDNCPVPLVLPVSLISFDGYNEGGKNILEWITASELNNDMFVIERSLDGQRFESIGRVKSNGNSAMQQHYTFADTSPLPGINYYRLRQIDYNGRSDFSQTITIYSSRMQAGINIYPNPANEKMFCEYNAGQESAVIFAVTDLLGNIISEEKTKILKGENTFSFNISALPAGIYFLRAGGCAGKFVKE